LASAAGNRGRFHSPHEFSSSSPGLRSGDFAGGTGHIHIPTPVDA
jgi:hypothetical protein